MNLPDLNDLEDIILTIEEEDGTETECQVICMFEYEEKAYAALTPTKEDSDEAYLFAVEFEQKKDEIEFTIENIDDDELLEELSKVFQDIMDKAAEDEDDDGLEEVKLPEGVSFEKRPDDGESHERILAGGDDDSYWDQFINKKLEEI